MCHVWWDAAASLPTSACLHAAGLLGSGQWAVGSSQSASPPVRQSVASLSYLAATRHYAPFAPGYSQYGSLSEGFVACLHAAWHTWHGRGAGEASGNEPLSGVPWAFSRPTAWPHRLAAGQDSVIVALCSHSCAPTRAR
jgi:hypothetical protein